MDRARQKQAIISNGWSTVGMAVVASATLAVLYAAVWIGEWRANMDNRLANLEKRVGAVETEVREMRGEMREMREENRMIQESLARIEQRLAE